MFDSSMNYRSAVIYSVPTVVPPEEKERALLRLTVDGGRNGSSHIRSPALSQ